MQPRYSLSGLFIWIAIIAICGAIGRVLELPIVLSAILITWLVVTAAIQQWAIAEAALWLSMGIGVAISVATMPAVRPNPPELVGFGVIFCAFAGMIMATVAFVLMKLVGRITVRQKVV